MLKRIKRLSIFFAFFLYIIYVRADCDICKRESFVACHSETVFSLCIQGKATRDYITCPAGYVCTEDDFTCYPKERVTPSCARSYIVTENRINQCGICNEPNQKFACLNETTIAFCYGQKSPDFESTDGCPDGMICDLKNNKQFCSDATRVEPSCIVEHVPSEPVTTTTTTEEPTTVRTTTEELTTTTTTTEEPNTTTTTTEILTTTTTTTKETISTTTTTEEPSTTTTMSRTTTTEKPTTPSTTPTTEKPTTMSTTTTTTTEKPTTPSTTPTTEKPTTMSTTTEKATTPSTTTTTEKTTMTTTTTTEQPTPTTEGTTTTRAPRSPNTLCKEMGESGNYRPDGDLASCTKFINCYVLNGNLRGTERECENENDFFDPVIRKCGENKPEDCA